MSPLTIFDSNAATSEFFSSLKDAEGLDQGFSSLEKLVSSLGFDSIAYSALPRSFGEHGYIQPVFLSSDEFSRGFLAHYDEAGLWQHDFTIERILGGFMEPMDWGKEKRESRLTASQAEVIDLAREDYGVNNAISIPLQSDRYIISGASVTSRELRMSFDRLIDERLVLVKLALCYFHQFVFQQSCNSRFFYQPLLSKFTELERRILVFATTGRPLKQSRDHTRLSPTHAGNVLSSLYERLGVSNRSELCFLVGHHRLLDML